MTFPQIKGVSGLGLAWLPVAKGGSLWPSTDSISFSTAACWADESPRIVHAWANWAPDGSIIPTPRDSAFPNTDWVKTAARIFTSAGEVTGGVAVGITTVDDGFRRVVLYRRSFAFALQTTYVTSFKWHKTVFVDHRIVWAKKMAGRNVTRVEFAGRVQWECDGKERSWQERPQWNGTVPLGAPLTLDLIKKWTDGIPDAEFQENTREAYAAADVCGTSIRDRWRIGLPVDALAFDQWPATGYCDEDYIHSTGALGDVSVGKRDEMDQAIVDMATGFHARAPKGRFTEGNPPERVFVADGRVDAHRPGSGSYYEWGNTLGREWARQGDPELLRCFRLLVSHTVQMGQVGAVDATLDKWHQYLGAFWKRGEPVGSPPGMNESDAWSARLGRAPDPFHLLFAWVFDGDQQACDAFRLWFDNVSFKEFSGGRNRESGKTIGVVADVCEWVDQAPQGDLWVKYLHQLVQVQIGTPGFKQSPNSLWDPLWVNKALPHLNPVLGAQLLRWAMQWRKDIETAGITKNPNETEAMGLSVAAHLGGDEPRFLHQHESAIAHFMKRASLVGPGPLGDDFICAQWGAFRDTFIDATPGTYERKFNAVIPIANLSFQDYGNIAKKGTRLHVDVAESPLRIVLDVQGTHPISWVVTSASGAVIEKGDIRDVRNPALAIPVPEPGVYHVCLGGHAGELFRPLGLKAVELPPGTYFLRAPNLYPFSGNGSYRVFADSKLSKMGALIGEEEMRWIPKEGLEWSGQLDLIGGQDPVAHIVTMTAMELL